LSGTVALVTGGSRGVGRGIARALGRTGATVYVTGRTRSHGAEPEPGTIEDAARDVDRGGGRGIAVPCDHTRAEEIAALFARIGAEAGRLDLLVNNVHSGIADVVDGVGRSFWEQDPGVWDRMNDAGLRGHYLATVHAARLMVPRRTGLIINISSFGALGYLFGVPYGVGKAALDRLTRDAAHELRSAGIAVLSIWPSLVRTELTGEALQDLPGGYRRILDAYGEPPVRTGLAVTALASDPHVLRFSGRALVVAEVLRRYGVRQEDGRRPRSPRSLTTLAAAILPPRWNALAAVVPPIRMPLFAVRRVLTGFSDHLRARGGYR